MLKLALFQQCIHTLFASRCQHNKCMPNQVGDLGPSNNFQIGKTLQPRSETYTMVTKLSCCVEGQMAILKCKLIKMFANHEIIYKR